MARLNILNDLSVRGRLLGLVLLMFLFVGILGSFVFRSYRQISAANTAMLEVQSGLIQVEAAQKAGDQHAYSELRSALEELQF